MHAHGIPICEDCGVAHPLLFEGHECISMSKFNSRLCQRQRNSNCERHPGIQMDFYCKGCEKVLCHHCGIAEHNGHNMIYLQEAAEKERTYARDLCAEGSSFVDDINVELHKLEQKRTNNVHRSDELHLDIDVEADALVSKINAWRCQTHEDIDSKVTNRLRELDDCRQSLESIMSRSQNSRAQLLRIVEEASDAAIMESAQECMKDLAAVLQEGINKSDRICEDEVMVSRYGSASFDNCSI